MEDEILFDSLDGFFAYDGGCTDSGIKNEVLKEKVKNYLLDLPDNEMMLKITNFIRIQYLSEKAISKGYGIADIKEFIKWIEDYLEINI